MKSMIRWLTVSSICLYILLATASTYVQIQKNTAFALLSPDAQCLLRGDYSCSSAFAMNTDDGADKYYSWLEVEKNVIHAAEYLFLLNCVVFFYPFTKTKEDASKVKKSIKLFYFFTIGLLLLQIIARDILWHFLDPLTRCSSYPGTMCLAVLINAPPEIAYRYLSVAILFTGAILALRILFDVLLWFARSIVGLFTKKRPG